MVLKVEKPVHCTLVGDAMIGKSTLVQAFMEKHLPQTPYVATVLETYEGKCQRVSISLYLFYVLLRFVKCISENFILICKI